MMESLRWMIKVAMKAKAVVAKVKWAVAPVVNAGKDGGMMPSMA